MPRPMKRRAPSSAKAQAALFPIGDRKLQRQRARGPARSPAPPAAVQSASGWGLGIRRNTARRSAAVGISTSGARLRRQVESDTAAAQASAADLDNAKLSQQAELATAYFNLRAADSLIDLLAAHDRGIQEDLRHREQPVQSRLFGHGGRRGDRRCQYSRPREAQLAMSRARHARNSSTPSPF